MEKIALVDLLRAELDKTPSPQEMEKDAGLGTALTMGAAALKFGPKATRALVRPFRSAKGQVSSWLGEARRGQRLKRMGTSLAKGVGAGEARMARGVSAMRQGGLGAIPGMVQAGTGFAQKGVGRVGQVIQRIGRAGQQKGISKALESRMSVKRPFVGTRTPSPAAPAAAPAAAPVSQNNPMSFSGTPAVKPSVPKGPPAPVVPKNKKGGGKKKNKKNKNQAATEDAGPGFIDRAGTGAANVWRAVSDPKAGSLSQRLSAGMAAPGAGTAALAGAGGLAAAGAAGPLLRLPGRVGGAITGGLTGEPRYQSVNGQLVKVGMIPPARPAMAGGARGAAAPMGQQPMKGSPALSRPDLPGLTNKAAPLGLTTEPSTPSASVGPKV